MSIIKSSEIENDISKYIKPLKLDNVNSEDIKNISYFDLDCLIYVGHEYKDYINVSRWVN